MQLGKDDYLGTLLIMMFLHHPQEDLFLKATKSYIYAKESVMLFKYPISIYLVGLRVLLE